MDPHISPAPAPAPHRHSLGNDATNVLHHLPVAFRPSPGTYLRLRREAAGRSVDTVALLVAGAVLGGGLPAVERVATLVTQAERDTHVLSPAWAEALTRAFPFSTDIYGQLVAGLPTPALCTDCGCSWFDPCLDEVRMPCSWTDGRATLCTCCEARR